MTASKWLGVLLAGVLSAPASHAQIVAGDWHLLHYSATPSINAANVKSLGFAWAFATGTYRGLEATPLIVGTTLFTSGVSGRVYALEAATGRLLWKFEPVVAMQTARATCCDLVNRGVAYWNDKIYVAALDGWLYALDAESGAVLWRQDTIVDRHRGYSSTGAPLIAHGLILIGNAGADYDARGYLTAYDANSGKQQWRFYTVPGDPSTPDENPELKLARASWDAHSTWAQGGGGAVWDGLAYDPELDLVYVGTGNAAPFLQAKRSPRGGDNLFTSSVLALQARTGRLAWYFQETPGDQWDYDSTQPLMLVDRRVGGRDRKLLLHAPKNGIFYTLDRSDGKLVSAAPFAKVTWNTGLSPGGRPQIDRTAADYRGGARVVFPSFVGAHNWNPMAYSPRTGLVYLPTVEMGGVLFDSSLGAVYKPTLLNNDVGLLPAELVPLLRGQLPPPVETALRDGSLWRKQPDLRARSFLQAWDPIQQRSVWRGPDRLYWDHAGALANAGDLVFQGDAAGILHVYDARTGAVLKEIDTGSSMIAAPMEYQVGPTAYVAVMAGWGGGAWAIPHPESAAYQYGNAGRVLAFKLGGGEVPHPPALPPPDPIPTPPPPSGTARSIARGGQIFSQYCSICHPNQPRTGSADLRALPAGIHTAFAEIVRDGLLRDAGMPAWGDVLDEADINAIHDYLIDISWTAYRAQGKSPGAGPPDPAVPKHY